MLHHANRDDAVEAPLKCPIVEFSELDELVDAGFPGPIPCDTDLLGRDVDRDDTGPGRLRDVDRERAPARADLGHAHPGLQAELGGRAHEFVALGLLERLVFGIQEHAAGIVEPFVQEEPVEVGREVVVPARIRRCHADRIGLMPALQAAPQPSQDLCEACPQGPARLIEKSK